MQRFRGVAVLVLVPAVLAAAGCGGGKSSSSSPGAAEIVPASAPAYIAIDTDQSSSEWRSAMQLADKFPSKQKGLDSLARALKKQGVVYDRDIKPALGKELDVVWLDFAGGGSDVVALAQPGDEKAFERLIAKGNKTETDPSSKLRYEKVGDWEAMSDKQAVLDRFKQESTAATATLADDKTYQAAMKELGEDGLLRVYVNGAKVMDAVRQQGNHTVDKVVNEAGTLDWIVAGVGATSDGVRFDTFVRGTPGKVFKRNAGSGGVSFHPTLPGSVPADTVAYLSFHGTKNMLGSLKSVPQLETQDMAPVRTILQKLASLLQGENALYVRNPQAGGKLPEVTLLADPGASVDGATTLDGIFNDQKLDLKPSQRPHPATIAGVPAREIDFGGFRLVYGDVGGKLVVSDAPSGIAGVSDPSGTLADSQTYKDATNDSGLPDKTSSYLYVNVTGGLALGQKLANAPIPGIVKRNLGPLKSVIEYGVTRPSEIQVTFFVRIK